MTEQKDPKETTATATTHEKGVKTPPKKKSPARTAKKAKTASTGVGLALLALLVALGSGGTSYYLWQQLQKTERQLTQHSNSTVAGLKQQLTANRQQIQSLEQLTERTISDLSGNQQALEQTLSILRSQLGQERNDWSIAEVEYLLTIANRALLLTGDSGTAIAALEMANRSLTSQADPALLPAREQITVEIHALRSITRPDTETIALQLSALIGATEKLPMEGPAGPSPANVIEKSEASATEDSLQAAGRTLWEALKSLVTIRHDVESIQPLMAPDQRLFLRQNLQLKLESARLALLQRNTVLYRTQLEEAGRWIRRYFDNRQGSVSTALENIERLAAIDIAPPLPDISASLRLIREMKYRYPTATSTGTTSP